MTPEQIDQMMDGLKQQNEDAVGVTLAEEELAAILTHIAALEKRVKAADELVDAVNRTLSFRPVSQENVRLMLSALEAYRATGEAP